MFDRALCDGCNRARRIPAYRAWDDCAVHDIESILAEDTSGVIHYAILRSVCHVASAQRVRCDEVAE